MTTNQTIDGVLASRELLEVFAGPRNNTPEQMRKAMDELRALLDAPASDPDCIHCCGGGRDPFGAVCGCAAPKPAAQPQGEPVALKEAYEEGFSDGSRAGDDQYNWEGFRDELAKAWPVSDACKLYAEQPAPVAVVMPAEDTRRTSTGGDEAYQNGWNACLDELRRLNP